MAEQSEVMVRSSATGLPLSQPAIRMSAGLVWAKVSGGMLPLFSGLAAAPSMTAEKFSVARVRGEVTVTSKTAG